MAPQTMWGRWEREKGLVYVAGTDVMEKGLQVPGMFLSCCCLHKGGASSPLRSRHLYRKRKKKRSLWGIIVFALREA